MKKPVTKQEDLIKIKPVETKQEVPTRESNLYKEPCPEPEELLVIRMSSGAEHRCKRKRSMKIEEGIRAGDTMVASAGLIINMAHIESWVWM